ncbi:MAG: gliding motility-associated C-terminal domain-containing protein [Flavobacteriales bacterium]|nr:gliding motility-associated C-terminal domain-containing protein [Flavobacteriales bacterium]
MMKRTLTTLFAAGLLGAQHVSASHIVGGEILWECLGNNQYQITMNLFRDCFGITPGTQETITFDSPCGTASLQVTNQSITEVSQLCPEEIANSTCNGGTLPGIEQWTYTGIVTLPPCDSWTASWTSCCRNVAVLNIDNPGNADTYLEGTLNNADFPCDNSPVFNNQPIPYVCLGQQVLYSFGVSDVDGDSLGYEFISAMIAGGAPVIYSPGFSFQQPIPGITLDPFTGLMVFTPNQQGNFIVTVMVTEYDDQGNVIGTVMRDIQFVVIPCTNQAPVPTDGFITNFSGTAVQTGPYAVELCETDQFCFDFVINDPDVIDTLGLISNVSIALPGSTFSWTGVNPVSGTICWTAPAGTGGFHTFIINASDDACPVNAFQTYVYAVNVLTRTSAGPDQTICGPQTAQLEANGGSIFTWSVLGAGDPIVVGVNFSCNPCESPIADPSITTTYVVQSDLLGSCITSDTVTVFVVPDFTFVVTQSDSLMCLGEQVQLNIATNPNVPGYVYEWTPGTGLSNTGIANPVGTYGNPGTYEYLVEVTSPDGCVKLDTTIQVIVTPGYVPQFSVTQADSLICQGESTTFTVDLDCSFPSFCGLYDGPCCGPLSTTVIGPDSLFGTGFTYPAPFGHFYEGARHQILYRASELQAMGFSGGKISELAWNIQSIQGTAVYHEWNLRLGCTTQDELDNTNWIDGLTDVFYDDTLDIVTGWNVFAFPSSFNWDGVSNLVLEVCFNNDPHLPFYTNNSPTYYSTTAYNSVHWIQQDANPLICVNDPIFINVSGDRPNTRFTFCGGVDAGDITYSWTPTDGISDPSSGNPTVTPTSAPTTYTVTVGEAGSGCTAEAQVTVGWYPPAQVSFVPNPDEGVQPLSVFFDNTSAPGSTNFNWDLGNGSTSTDVNPSMVYTEPGWYYVLLTGYSENGCYGSYLDSILVLDQPIVIIPNVFSPDGDGNNDAFAFIDFRGFASFRMSIFNRWGQEIHSATSTQNNYTVWRPGKEVSDGTYYYEFVGNGSNGDNVVRTGHLTLLRKR